MGFVVEVTSRTGRVIEHRQFEKTTASVGRAYDNDVILNDPYVDAHHVQIENSLNGLSAVVLSQDGHTLIDKTAPTGTRIPLRSGAALVLGKTHLRVLASTHAVAPMLTFERIDRMFASLARPAIAVALTAVWLMVAAADQYLDTVAEIQWSRWLMQLLTPVLGALAWTSMWALITRVTRGEARFFHHWLVVLLFLLVSMAIEFVSDVLRFNLGEHVLVEVFRWGARGVVLAALFALHLRFAFQQSKAIRHLAAQTLAWAVVAYGILGTFSFEDDFEPYPTFESTLMPLAFLFRAPKAADVYLRDAQTLFEFSEEDLGRGAGPGGGEDTGG